MKHRLALVLAFVLSLIFNFYYITIHPFLHDWDEKFHALVAKNLSENFLLPLLYKNSPIAVCDLSWACNTIWLHKQPLFLWQMALSIKLFGVNQFAVRLPSALMLSLLVFPVYRIGNILFDKNTGLLASVLLVTNWFIIEHIDGTIGMDHNDIAFMFYVTLSVWAFIEFAVSNKFRYALLIGIFSGAAMLCKWVTGLLVFEAYIIYVLVSIYKRETNFKFKYLLPIVLAFVVFLPWQIYCYINFKDIALHEWNYNSKHFFEVVEGHEGDWFYYLENLIYQFNYVSILLLFGLSSVFVKSEKQLLKALMLLLIASIYVFFSIAKTKIASYTMVVMPLIFVFIAHGFFVLIQRISNKKYKAVLFIILLSVMFFRNFNWWKISKDHSLKRDYWFSAENIRKLNNKNVLKKVAKLNLSTNTAIIGVKHQDHIDHMFYTGLLTYNYDIKKELTDSIKNSGYKIAIYQNVMPPALVNDTDLVVLPYNYIE